MRRVFPNLMRLLGMLAIVIGLLAVASAPMGEAGAQTWWWTGGLTITPSSATPGTTVAVQGYGFTDGGSLASVTFGSVAAPIITPSSTMTPCSGCINALVVVPPLNPGTYTVSARDNYGVVKSTLWTVAKPTVHLSPTAGPTGTFLTVSGSGWIRTTNGGNYTLTSKVTVTIGGASGGSGYYGYYYNGCSCPAADAVVVAEAQVSGDGTFSVNTLVPICSPPGADCICVTEQVACSNNWAPSPTDFEAGASFTVTKATITLSTSQGTSGQRINFTGSGFPAYSQIDSIEFSQDTGTTYITPVPMPQIDANGRVAGSFNVPASVGGRGLIIVWCGSAAAGAAIFTVTVASETATPAAVFASLITNHQLARPVWSFNNVSKKWDMYDPNDLVGSTITLLKPGAAYWIYIDDTASVNLPWSVNIYTLSPGWNGVGWLK